MKITSCGKGSSLSGLQKPKEHGFTLTEIMLVAAILGLLVTISWPAYQRSRMRTQASIILEDLRLIDEALTLYASDLNLRGGTEVTFEQLRPYFKQGSKLHESGTDFLGNPYGPFTVNKIPAVHESTYQEYLPVADATFWRPFYEVTDP